MVSLLKTSDFRIPLTGRRIWHRYVVVLATVGLAAGAGRILANYWPSPTASLSFYYVAVLVSAWYGGWLPGMLTALLGAVWGLYSGASLVPLILFLFSATVICLLTENLHRLLLRHSHTTQALVGTQKRVRSILESVQGCFLSLDQDGNFLHINKECEKYFDGDYRRFAKKPLWEAFPSWKGTEFESKLNQARATKQSVEFEYQSPPGGAWQEVHISPTTEGVSIHFYDITARKRAERDLVESEDRFRRIADQAPVMIWTTDAAGVRNYVNQPWLNFRGRKLEEELGRGWKIGIHSKDREKISDIFNSSFAARSGFRKEYRWQRFDGVYRWVVSNGTPRFDGNGKFIGYIGSVVDITETRQTLRERQAFLRRHNEILVNLSKRQQLKEVTLEERLREITEAAAEGLEVPRSSVWFFSEDRRSLRCMDLFDRENMAHRQEADLDVATYPIYFDGLERFRAIAAEDALNDPRTREFAEGYLKPSGILSMLDSPIRLHGRTIGVLCSEATEEIRPWTLEEQGFAASLADMVALAVEERDRSAAEAALKRSERRMRRLLDSDAIGIIYGDARTGVIHEANEVFLRMAGYSRKEMNAGQLAWPELIPPDFLEKGWCEPFEKEWVRKDGSLVPQMVGLTALDDSCREFACFVVDLSESKMRERSQAMEYAITQVLAIAPLLSAAINMVLQAICKGLDWELGAFWENLGEGRLRCSEIWSPTPEKFRRFFRATEEMEYQLGDGLPGRILNADRATWFPDLATTEGFLRKKAALADHLVSAVGFPVYLDKKLLGVFEFYSTERREFHEHSMAMLDVVGSEIGQFIDRKRTQESLRLSQQHLRLALQAARMGFWSWDIKTKQLTNSGNLEFVNGRSDTKIESMENFLACVHPEDQTKVLKTFETAIAQRRDYKVEFRSLWPDGSVHWNKAQGQIYYDENHEPEKMICLGIDITERKKTEAELEAINYGLENRVEERTAELAQANRRLQDEIQERQKVEREALEMIQKEQKRFSAQLHDGLCQSLAGTMMMAKASVQKLEKQKIREAEELKNVIELISQSVGEARDLARGLFPVELEANALMLSLRTLASRTEQLFKVRCEFDCPIPILIGDNVIATHLYRIAQEAINNAIRHGEAKKLKLSLLRKANRLILQLADDGVGMSQDLTSGSGAGIGLHIMKYRARMMDADLSFEHGKEGTLFTCEVPMPPTEGLAQVQ